MNAGPEVAVIVDGEIMTEEQHTAAQRSMIEALYTSFAKMRDEWVQHRASSGVELRWKQASSLYFGDADQNDGTMRDILANGPQPQRAVKDDPRSKVVVNIVRPKVDQAIARMCEILLPVDDRNWAIRPTPKPEVLSRIGNTAQTVDAQGRPTGLTADAEANALMQAAKEAAESMQNAIDDELTECNYNGESRKMIEDGVRMGTGVLKGPFPVRHCDTAWEIAADGTSKRSVKERIRTASRRVDPVDVFPDPSAGNDHQRGRGIWERRSVTRKELRALNGIPGYDSEAIRAVLSEPPQKVRVAEKRIMTEFAADQSYELWEYHGEVEPEEVYALSTKAGGEALLDVQHAVLIMVNNRIIGAMESWIEDKSIPYDFWCWRKDDISPFGHSLPGELAHQQSVVNAAWRQVMDNARVSVGGQIVMKRGAVVPADGNPRITPNKLWYAKDDEVDVTKAFHVFEFQSHIGDLLAVANAAMNFADMETTLPQIMGGEQGSAPETVGGMVLLYNNANAVLRQRVKLYDDNVTKPHIGRYYDFKMANDEDPTIKGDFDVDARGSTALVERDIQNQAMLNLANITNMPRYSPHLKVRDELKAILKAFKMNPDDLMKTEEQANKDMAATPQQQDPRIVSAQLQAQTAQADIADRERQRQFEAQLAQQDSVFKFRQLEYNRAREQAEFTIAQTDSEINRAGIILREQNKAQLTREQIQAKERLNLLNIESKHQIFNAEASLRVNTGEGI